MPAERCSIKSPLLPCPSNLPDASTLWGWHGRVKLAHAGNSVSGFDHKKHHESQMHQVHTICGPARRTLELKRLRSAQALWQPKLGDAHMGNVALMFALLQHRR